MRICLLTSDFWPNIGGVAAHVYGLARALTLLGHTIIVVHTAPNASAPPPELTAGFRVYSLPFHTHPFLPLRLWRLRQIATQVAALAQAHDIQVLHWHTLRPEGLLTKMVRRPRTLKVFTNHTSGYLAMVETPAGRLQARMHLGHAQGVIAPSQELADQSRWLGIPASRIAFIPNAVDTDRFYPAPPDRALQTQWGLAPDVPVVLCPRRMVPKNGVRYLAEAIPLIVPVVKKVHFLIVGDGEDAEKAYIEHTLSQTEVAARVTLTGPIPNTAMPALYQLAAITVLPSLVEATSIAGLEAMASGCPLVGTNVGGIPTLIEAGRTGLLVPPANPDALAQAILSLLQDEAQRKSMGTAARDRAQQEFSWRHIAERTVQMYIAWGAQSD